MAKATRRLGRGLSSLVSSDLSQQTKASEPQHPPSATVLDGLRGVGPTNRLMHIPVEQVRQNPMQPRRRFDEGPLAALAASIREKGTLQPIVVRSGEAGYELVAGERRLRAAKMACLTEIPAIVRLVQDDELLELALAENIHREDLNPIERARAYRALHESYGLSHDEIGQRMGEDRATVTNYIRLLGLPDEVQQLIETDKLGIGHSKAILGVSNPHTQVSFALRAIRQGWSVRRLEAAIAREKRGAGAPSRERPVRPAVEDMEQKLAAALGTRVTIREGRRRHAGKLVIEYYSLEDFQRIAGLLGIAEEPS